MHLDETNTVVQFYVYISFLSQVIAKKRFVISDDLMWPCKVSLVKMALGSSRLA